MNAIAVMLACVVALLFYRFVERRHKLAFAKGLAGLAAIVIVAAVAIYVKNDRESKATYELERRTFESITVVVEEGAPKTVQFRVCNASAKAIHRTKLTASGFMRGRSTAYPLGAPQYERDSYASYSSDQIIDSKTCRSLAWPLFRPVGFDSTHASVAGVEFDDGSKVGYIENR